MLIITLDYILWMVGIKIEFFDPFGYEFIYEQLKKERIQMTESEIVEMLKPRFFLCSEVEEQDLSRIALTKNKSKKDKLLMKHQQKYFWSSNDWANARIVSASHFQKRLNTSDGV